MISLEKIGQKTYYITGPFHVGIYVLDEAKECRPVCLIDSGIDADTAKEIDELLIRNNFCVELIINTHYHADHCGGDAYFKKAYGCTIVATKVNAAMISNYDICTPMVWGACPIPEIENKYFYATPTEAEDIDKYELPNGLSTEELPGHCISMIAVRTDDDVLFLGDAVISPETLEKHPLSYIYEIENYLQSLDKLAGISAALYVPYHAEPTTDIAGLVKANKEGVQGNIEAVRKICQIPRTQEEVMSIYYKMKGMTLNVYKYALEGSVIRTYLAYLYNSGAIEAVVEDNFIKWKTK